MPMTIVVTRNVAPRYRGFLASVMLEIAPGVYTSPQMSKGVRERVWDVLTGWFDFKATIGAQSEDSASIVMTWRDVASPGGQQILTLGLPAKTLVDADGIMIVNRLQADVTAPKTLA
jgi:CRISPR-associated protein Cas2